MSRGRRLGATLRQSTRYVARHGVRARPLDDRVRGDGRAAGDGDPSRAAAAGHAAAGGARAVRRGSGSRARRLRQALVALGQSGYLRAMRGRGGGTFVAEPLPPAQPPPLEVLERVARHLRRADGGRGRDRGARRRARDAGGDRRARPRSSTRSDRCSRTSPATAQADIRFHVGARRGDRAARGW